VAGAIAPSNLWADQDAATWAVHGGVGAIAMDGLLKEVKDLTRSLREDFEAVLLKGVLPETRLVDYASLPRQVVSTSHVLAGRDLLRLLDMRARQARNHDRILEMIQVTEKRKAQAASEIRGWAIAAEDCEALRVGVDSLTASVASAMEKLDRLFATVPQLEQCLTQRAEQHDREKESLWREQCSREEAQLQAEVEAQYRVKMRAALSAAFHEQLQNYKQRGREAIPAPRAVAHKPIEMVVLDDTDEDSQALQDLLGTDEQVDLGGPGQGLPSVGSNSNIM